MLQNLYTVIRREIRIWRNRPIYFLGSVGVMLCRPWWRPNVVGV